MFVIVVAAGPQTPAGETATALLHHLRLLGAPARLFVEPSPEVLAGLAAEVPDTLVAVGARAAAARAGRGALVELPARRRAVVPVLPVPHEVASVPAGPGRDAVLAALDLFTVGLPPVPRVSLTHADQQPSRISRLCVAQALEPYDHVPSAVVRAADAHALDQAVHDEWGPDAPWPDVRAGIDAWHVRRRRLAQVEPLRGLPVDWYGHGWAEALGGLDGAVFRPPIGGVYLARSCQLYAGVVVLDACPRALAAAAATGTTVLRADRPGFAQAAERCVRAHRPGPARPDPDHVVDLSGGRTALALLERLGA